MIPVSSRMSGFSVEFRSTSMSEENHRSLAALPLEETTMNKTAPASRTSSLIIMLAGALMAACVDDQPIAPVEEPAIVAQMSNQTSDENEAFATLRRVTARYHRLD